MPGAGNNSFRPALGALDSSKMSAEENIERASALETKGSMLSSDVTTPLLDQPLSNEDEPQTCENSANSKIVVTTTESASSFSMDVADVDSSLNDSSSLVHSGEGDSLLGRGGSSRAQFEDGPDPTMYPADLNGFLSGLSDGLSNVSGCFWSCLQTLAHNKKKMFPQISRDLKSSKFAAGVSVSMRFVLFFYATTRF